MSDNASASNVEISKLKGNAGGKIFTIVLVICILGLVGGAILYSISDIKCLTNNCPGVQMKLRKEFVDPLAELGWDESIKSGIVPTYLCATDNEGKCDDENNSHTNQPARFSIPILSAIVANDTQLRRFYRVIPSPDGYISAFVLTNEGMDLNELLSPKILNSYTNEMQKTIDHYNTCETNNLLTTRRLSLQYMMKNI